MADECRAFAVDRFNAVDVGKKYQSVFEHLISGTDVSALEFKVDPRRRASEPLKDSMQLVQSVDPGFRRVNENSPNQTSALVDPGWRGGCV